MISQYLKSYQVVYQTRFRGTSQITLFISFAIGDVLEYYV